MRLKAGVLARPTDDAQTLPAGAARWSDSTGPGWCSEDCSGDWSGSWSGRWLRPWERSAAAAAAGGFGSGGGGGGGLLPLHQPGEELLPADFLDFGLLGPDSGGGLRRPAGRGSLWLSGNCGRSAGVGIDAAPALEPEWVGLIVGVFAHVWLGAVKGGECRVWRGWDGVEEEGTEKLASIYLWVSGEQTAAAARRSRSKT
ncbi:hypothetical protein QBC33DRAFT_595041 [Phialemonium atrogriseum]|uniref:Uncharacterized protein n=1 Tax=Phialemonium atrogriseum TaxID=1093897 RepID=A0AAJ0BVY9_9PEZI|nr:uncharacterized protein QBC33DRAFT_595041 [Phialemonium atrogriseum]KAK1764418.1 hypothetical protein QBC33DRAFT_595041 [Phialemonium atrogriseum]